MKKFVISDPLNHTIYSEQMGIEGMSRIGTVNMRGATYEIFVCTNDPGKIPHFHVRDMDDWSRFHTCVRIDVPEYFHHGNKQDTFNSRERKQLQDFMNQCPKKKMYDENGNQLNNWQVICFMWDINNSDVEIKENTSQPDYTKLH